MDIFLLAFAIYVLIKLVTRDYHKLWDWADTGGNSNPRFDKCWLTKAHR